MGGACVPNGNIWEVGITPVVLTALGKRVLSTNADTLVRLPFSLCD